MISDAYLSFIIDQNCSHVVCYKPLLTFHNDVEWWFVRCADIGRPHQYISTSFEFRGTMKLENCFQSTSFTKKLPTAQTYFLLQKLYVVIYVIYNSNKVDINFFQPYLAALIGEFHKSSLGICLCNFYITPSSTCNTIITTTALFTFLQQSAFSFTASKRGMSGRSCSTRYRRVRRLHRCNVQSEN